MLRYLLASVVAFSAVPAFAEPLLDLSQESFAGASKASGGVAFSFNMGAKRVNWTNARWSVCALRNPKDLSKAGGIQVVVATDKPRTDAGVYIALREADGSWWYSPWAANLSQASNTGTASFDDFFTADYTCPSAGDGKDTHVDKNGKLDLDQITHVAIGCINPFGVGKLDFTVTALNLLPPAGAQLPVKVEIAGKLLDVNGTTTIPAGVFGGYHFQWMVDGKDPFEALRLAQDRRINAPVTFGKTATTWMMINTWGDRIGRSPRVNNPNWEAAVTATATAAGTQARQAGKPLFVEYWNEPYLNWANKNRITFNPADFNQEEAAEGAPVKLKSDGTVLPHMKWTQNYDTPPWNWVTPRYSEVAGVVRDHWRRGKDADGKMYSMLYQPYRSQSRGGVWNPAAHPPREVKDGEKYKIKLVSVKGKGNEATRTETEVELTAFTPWYPYDETQFTFWSAKGVGIFYNDPMVAAGKALKAACPEATYIAGWGFRPSEDHWAAWELTYKPTIDAGYQYIDGICDHDYGGDPTKSSAGYEVITAYGKTKYNKWLHGYNTECAAVVDPQAYAGAAGGPDAVKYVWGARKLMHTLAYEADKARSISWFGQGGSFVTENGEGAALKMLKNLRGRLVHVYTGDPGVYAVAAIDGTDPRNPRPADMVQRKELVVALLNDYRTARSIDLLIAPPKGTKFETALVRRAETGGVATTISEKEEKVTTGTYKLQAALAPRDLIVYTFPLTGEIAADARSEVQVRQFFAPAVVVDVKADQPLRTEIKVDEAVLKNARRAYLRIVAERLSPGEGALTLNGKEYPLPSCVSPDNNPLVRQMPLNLEDVKGANTLVFKVNAGHAGYFLGMASVIVESE